MGVSLDFEGREYLINFAPPNADLQWLEMFLRAADIASYVHQSDSRWVLLRLADGMEPADTQLVGSVEPLGVILDLSHLDAAVCGLRPLAELLRDTFRRRQVCVPLTELLAVGELAAETWAMTPAVRLAFPLAVETQTWAGAAAEVLLVGQAQEARPTGLALLDDRTALITCPDGLLETDLARGGARWHLALPGCHGTPLIGEDGAVLVMCGSAVVRWHQGQLSAVAGGFEPGSSLLPGPRHEAWVLSGSGVTFGSRPGQPRADARR